MKKQEFANILIGGLVKECKYNGVCKIGKVEYDDYWVTYTTGEGEQILVR